MKKGVSKSVVWYQLLGVFCGVALLMIAYEFSKELIFRGKLTLWESHLITVFVTATLATIASLIMRRSRKLEKKIEEEVERRMQQERMLIEQSRLAAMGEMIGNIAHQWRQPLTGLALILGNIKDGYEHNALSREALAEQVGRGQQLIQMMSSTINDFRDFFKPSKEKKRFRPRDGIASAIKLVGDSFHNNNIAIELDEGGERCQAMGYPNEFSQVVLNVLANAKDAMVQRRGAGTVTIRIADDLPDDGVVTVVINDSGGGIPEAILPRVFEPYFTTKEKGTGIGLSMSKMIMDRMDGDIVIRNTADGAEVLLTLPLAKV